MRTAVELDTKTAERLREIADMRRVSLEELLAAHVPGLAVEDPVPKGSPEDKVRAFDAWVADFPASAPPLSQHAVSRSSIYSDR